MTTAQPGTWQTSWRDMRINIYDQNGEWVATVLKGESITLPSGQYIATYEVSALSAPETTP